MQMHEFKAVVAHLNPSEFYQQGFDEALGPNMLGAFIPGGSIQLYFRELIDIDEDDNEVFYTFNPPCWLLEMNDAVYKADSLEEVLAAA